MTLYSLSPLVRHMSALVRGENGQTCFPDKDTKNSCSCGGISYSGQNQMLNFVWEEKRLYSTNKVNLSITKFKEVRPMEVKKHENLKFIVLLGDKNSPQGQMKRYSSPKTSQKKSMKSSVRVASKPRQGITEFACLNFVYSNSKRKQPSIPKLSQLIYTV